MAIRLPNLKKQRRKVKQVLRKVLPLQHLPVKAVAVALVPLADRFVFFPDGCLEVLQEERISSAQICSISISVMFPTRCP